MSSPPDNINSTELARKLVFYTAFAILAAYVMFELKALLICLVFAVTLASAMAPVAEWGEQRKIPRVISVMLIYGATILVYVVLGASLVPTLKTEGKQLYDKLPAYIDKVTGWIDSSSSFLGSATKTDTGSATSTGVEADEPPVSTAVDPSQQAMGSKQSVLPGTDTGSATSTDTGSATGTDTGSATGTDTGPAGNSTKESALHLAHSLPMGKEDIRKILNGVFQKSISMTAGVMGLAANVVLTLFLAAYFVIEAKNLCADILKWLTPGPRERLRGLIIPLETRLGGFVRGQLLVSLCVGLFLFAGFSILGLHYAMLLGLIAALLNLVPYVGSLIATSSAILVALNQDGGGPMLAALVFGLYALEQWVESSFIVPHLLGRSVDLHPLVVLLSILIGASLLGIAGALIAIPLTSVGILLAEEFYLKPMQEKESVSHGTSNS